MNALTHQKPTADHQATLPAIQTGQALLSLRDSGFSLPTALAEVVDNSIEAKASRIRIEMEDATANRAGKHVRQIAVVDDGEGMDVDTLWHYPVIGFSTRYMRTDTIGKYGVGAKLAALNFGRRIDVWSRQSASVPWMHVHFDLDDALAAEQEAGNGNAGIEHPNETSVPKELQALLPEGSGTLVLWNKVDRLEEGRLAPNFDELKTDVIKDLARVFREFLDGGIKIEVNGIKLVPHDPLFLMQGTWADTVLTKHMRREEGGKGGKRLEHYPADVIWEDPVKISGSAAKVRITLYPPQVTRRRGLGGDTLARELRVPDNEGCISFMRRGREIAYTNVPRILPLGIQPIDRFIGIEVSFDPTLDAYFGVRNVKRGVEPHGELRDKIRTLLAKHIPQARKKLDERWGEIAVKQKTETGDHGAIIDAVAEIDHVLPGSRTPPPSEEKVEQELKDLAHDAGYDESKKDLEEYIERTKGLPFVLENVDFPGKQFIDVRLLGNKVIIRLNTRHRFYRELWQPLGDIAGMSAGAVSGEEAVKAAKRAVEGLVLMVIAYGKAMSMSDKPDDYDDLTSYWGQFLDTLMGRVKDVQ
jgi:Histidine kinase-, DNA gyrase B-, and HSP90-like ATPase